MDKSQFLGDSHVFSHLTDKFIDITKEIGFDFKLIGELIWCNELVENENK